jgi:hypothetical protein
MATKEPEPQAEGVHPKNKRPRKGMPPAFKKKGEKQKDDEKEKGQVPKEDDSGEYPAESTFSRLS